MENADTTPGPHTGDMRQAGLMVHLGAGPELPLASLCTSGHVRWASVLGLTMVLGLTLVLGLVTALPCARGRQGDMGLGLAGSLTPGGWEGTLVCAVTRPGTCTVC